MSRYRTYWPIMPRHLPGGLGPRLFSIILLPAGHRSWWATAPQVRWLPTSRPGYPRAASSSWTEMSPGRAAQPHRSGPTCAISSAALPKPMERCRSGQNGSPATRDARLLSALISWPAIPWPWRGSKVNFRPCVSIGSTTRSNSRAGITYPPASSKHRRFMIMQPRKRSDVAGQLRDCRARTCIPCSVPQRLRTPLLPCRVDLGRFNSHRLEAGI